MKKNLAVTVFMTIAAASAGAAAEETERQPASQIEQIIKDSATALNAGNYEGAFKHLHPTEWSQYGASPQGGVVSIERKDLVGLARAFFPAAKVRVSAPMQLKVQVHGDAAFATYLQNNEYETFGVQRANTLRITNVFFKVDGEWRMVHSHESHLIAQ